MQLYRSSFEHVKLIFSAGSRASWASQTLFCLVAGVLAADEGAKPAEAGLLWASSARKKKKFCCCLKSRDTALCWVITVFRLNKSVLFFFDRDVTSTNNTEMGSSSANKFCPTPSLLNTEVRRKFWWLKTYIFIYLFIFRCVFSLPTASRSRCRDAGDERLDPELFREKGGGLRFGEKRSAQRP